MTERKHTPGPWEIDPMPHDMYLYADFSYIGINKRLPVAISVNIHHYDDLGEGVMEANARLIAAAPDLMKVLEEEELALEEDLRWAEGLKEHEGLSFRLERVRAAIRSVKGE